MNCPVCGQEDAVCGGGSTHVVLSGMKETGMARMRVPKQRATRGIPGYVGDVEVYDPEAPSLPLVEDDEDEEPEAKEIAAPAENKARAVRRRKSE